MSGVCLFCGLQQVPGHHPHESILFQVVEYQSHVGLQKLQKVPWPKHLGPEFPVLDNHGLQDKELVLVHFMVIVVAVD